MTLILWVVRIRCRRPIPSAGQSSETETHTARSRKKLDQVSLPRPADGNMPSLVDPEDDNALHTTGDKRHASGRHLTFFPVPLLLLSLLWSLDYCEPSWRLPASGYILQAGPRHVKMSGWTACLALYGWRVLTAQAAILVAKTPLGGRVSSLGLAEIPRRSRRWHCVSNHIDCRCLKRGGPQERG